jgi:hypothetical protein
MDTIQSKSKIMAQKEEAHFAASQQMQSQVFA